MSRAAGFLRWRETWLRKACFCRSWRRAAAAAFAILARGGRLAAPAGATPRPAPSAHFDRRHAQMDQRLSRQAGAGRAAGAGARAQRSAGVQGRRELGRLSRLHRRGPQRQSRPRRSAGRPDAADCAGRSLGAGARHRLFRPAELARSTRDLRRPHADAARHDRQISRRQAADARSDRFIGRPSPACSTRSGRC